MHFHAWSTILYLFSKTEYHSFIFLFFWPREFFDRFVQIKEEFRTRHRKAKGTCVPHGGPHTCGGRGRGEVPSASASCEPNSTCKPFLFPALFFSHTPQPWPVDEERQISLTTAGRAANQQGRLLDPKITFPKAFFFSLLDQYQHSFLLGSNSRELALGWQGSWPC